MCALGVAFFGRRRISALKPVRYSAILDYCNYLILTIVRRFLPGMLPKLAPMPLG
jgi:hypothetical protein